MMIDEADQSMRQTACLENLDLRTPRGLDRSTMAALGSGQWIRQHLNVLLVGPAGIGKSWIACALGNHAARDGVSVLYKRLPRLLDDLAGEPTRRYRPDQAPSSPVR